MYDTDWTIPLPETTRAWREDPAADLEAVLEAELIPMGADLAQGGCEEGGRTEDEEVMVALVSVTDTELRAEITVYFIEVIPSSCKDMPHQERRDRRLVLCVPRGSTTGYLDLSDSDPQGWTQEEKNSAADGK